jgi:hypothetical protein
MCQRKDRQKEKTKIVLITTDIWGFYKKKSMREGRGNNCEWGDWKDFQKKNIKFKMD